MTNPLCSIPGCQRRWIIIANGAALCLYHYDEVQSQKKKIVEEIAKEQHGQ